ncbi:hypothetical protein [Reichenbachiella sp.]|uniref:hypothetical protein n=1 Tax=Reichenbachiella sp. TaxID=2184521 RepID=UPI003BAF48B0
MKDIKMDRDKGDVSIKINISGLVGWKFAFATTDNDKPFSEKSSQTDKNEFKYLLGSPEDLFLDNNNWDFVLVNTGEEKQEYELKIQWLQKDIEIDVWKDSGELDVNGIVEKPGNARLI